MHYSASTAPATLIDPHPTLCSSPAAGFFAQLPSAALEMMPWQPLGPQDSQRWDPKLLNCAGTGRQGREVVLFVPGSLSHAGGKVSAFLIHYSNCTCVTLVQLVRFAFKRENISRVSASCLMTRLKQVIRKPTVDADCSSALLFVVVSYLLPLKLIQYFL